MELMVITHPYRVFELQLDDNSRLRAFSVLELAFAVAGRTHRPTWAGMSFDERKNAIDERKNAIDEQYTLIRAMSPRDDAGYLQVFRSPIEVSCPRCGAGPDVRCSGPDGQFDSCTYHAARDFDYYE